jgi:Trm5-related predicted tRNA methylase
MKLLFLDESGDHSLDKIDPQYPVFVLGGIIVDEEYAKGELTQRVQKFKQDLFGRLDAM